MSLFGSTAGDLVEVRLDPDDLVMRIERMGGNSKMLPMDAFAALVVAEIDDVFQSEGVEGTEGKWDPLSLETLRRHPRRRGGKILQDTGAMANVQVKEAGDMRVVIASPTGYAQHHITGTRNMPKRDFFALNFEELLEELGILALQEMEK
jgi:phage gpG-like protein